MSTGVKAASLLLGVALLAGCSTTKAGSGSSSSAATGAVACDALPSDPQWSQKLASAGGCNIGDTLNVAASFNCRDGSKLYSFGPDGEYWGNSKAKLNKAALGVDVAGTPEYSAAYTACQQGSSSSGASTPSITSSPTPSPSPTEWTKAQAQAKYLAIVAPYNKLLDHYNALGSQPTLAVLAKACAGLAAENDRSARELAAGLWPAAAKAAVGALVVSITKERAGWQGCATARTAADAYDATFKVPDASPEAEAVRIALGLPGNS